MAEAPPAYEEPAYNETPQQQQYGQPQQYGQQQQYAQQQPYGQQQQPYTQQQQQPVVYVQQPPPQQQPVVYAQQPPPQQQPVYTEEPYYGNNGTNDNVADPNIEPPAATKVAPTSDDEGFGTSEEYGERLDYSKPEYRDKIWAIIWLIHLVAMFILLFGSFSADSVGTSGSSGGYTIIFVCAALGAIFGYLWMLILRKFAGIIIKFMMWANLIFLIIATIMTFAAGLIFNAILLALITVFFGLYMWRVWHRIPFAEALLQIASIIIESYKGIIWTAFLCLGFQIIWILVWGGIMTVLINTGAIGEGYFIYFLLLISLYWNLETFKNISHCTTCGVGATWYFSPYPHNPTKSSLKRACTTSLGSIALGSLIVAVIQAVRELIRQLKNDDKINACLACCLDCILGCIERWVEWFNKYAFAHCAIYGDGFIKSAKETWALLKSKGIDAWINDDLVGFAIVCGALVGGFLCAAVGGLMVMVNDKMDDDLSTAFAFMGFFVGFYLCWTVLNTVASCVVAIFVCYAEDPQAMELNRPEQYHKLTAARNDCISPNEYDRRQEEEQMQQQQEYGQAQPPPQQQQYGQQPQQQQQYGQQPQQQQYGGQQQQYGGNGNMYGNY